MIPKHHFFRTQKDDCASFKTWLIPKLVQVSACTISGGPQALWVQAGPMHQVQFGYLDSF